MQCYLRPHAPMQHYTHPCTVVIWANEHYIPQLLGSGRVTGERKKAQPCALFIDRYVTSLGCLVNGERLARTAPQA